MLLRDVMHVNLLVIEDRRESIKEYLQYSILSFVHLELTLHSLFFVGRVSALMDTVIIELDLTVLAGMRLTVENVIECRGLAGFVSLHRLVVLCDVRGRV